jgi:uncharacterized Rmd1/YagE family protein
LPRLSSTRASASLGAVRFNQKSVNSVENIVVIVVVVLIVLFVLGYFGRGRMRG